MEFVNLDVRRWDETVRGSYWGSPERAEAFLAMLRHMPSSILNWEWCGSECWPEGDRIEVSGVLPTDGGGVNVVVERIIDDGPLYFVRLFLPDGRVLTLLRARKAFFDAILLAAKTHEAEKEERAEAEIKEIIETLADHASGDGKIEVYMG